MAFSSKQIRQLRAHVPADRVRERQVEGKTLHYIEGWHVVSEANRIFGFDGWDRETVSSQCVWQKSMEGRYAASYVTRIRLTVRAGDRVIAREGLGSGEAFAPTPGQAHERAAKAAETDATKRALSTFGNRFGLSLYRDKQVPPQAPAPQSKGAALPSNHGAGHSVDAGFEPAASNPDTRSGQGDLVEVPAQNETESSSEEKRPAHGYRVSAPINQGGKGVILETVKIADVPRSTSTSPSGEGRPMQLAVTAHVLPPSRIPIDKSALPIGEPRRHRCVDHLRFVARQPCLVCGRQPAQAHHLRYAQPRALSRKVSDEFTVPLCNFHHDEVHRTGNEFQWWRARGLDPLQAARVYWAETREFPGGPASLVDGPIANQTAPDSESSERAKAPSTPP